MQVVVVFAAGAAMTSGHNSFGGTEMPTIADITGAGHPGCDEAFAVAGQAAKGNNRAKAGVMSDGFPVAQRAILPGRKQGV
jgi:hypothetical protein